MSGNLLLRSVVVWFGFFALAFVNGAIREVGIKRVIGEPWAHHLSAATAIAIFTLYVAAVWRNLGVQTAEQAAWIGAFWFALTVLVETFVLNRWMSKLSWEEIVQSYNLARGNLWPVVLVWVGLLPIVMRARKG